MTTQQALLQAVCDNPEDDDVRLVYADWLDDTGDAENQARAEFIRLQVELARMAGPDETVEAAECRVDLELRTSELLHEKNRFSTWACPLRVVEGPALAMKLAPFAPGTFVRGFMNFAMAEPAEFLAAGESLFDISPVHGLYTSVSGACMVNESAQQFLQASWLKRIRRIEVNVAGEAAEQFFTADSLSELEELSLRSGGLSPPGTPVLSPALRRLRSLKLDGGFLRHPESVIRLAELLPDAHLTHWIAICHPQAKAEVMQALQNLPQFRTLKSLVLAPSPYHEQPLGRATIVSLSRAPCWNSLRTLRLGGLSDEEAIALAQAPPAPNLRELHVSHEMSIRGVTALAESPLLRSITDLDMGCGSGIGDDGAEALAKSTMLPRLFSLSLPVARIGPKGLKCLAGAAWAGNIVRLDLRDNALRQAGVDILANPACFPRLRRLELQRVVRTRKLQARLTERFGQRVRFWF
jgi:uncharacterized protein (TIGR02996 family)